MSKGKEQKNLWSELFRSLLGLNTDYLNVVKIAENVGIRLRLRLGLVRYDKLLISLKECDSEQDALHAKVFKELRLRHKRS